MELILLERVEKLGNMGDVVRVKDGYARNYLLPQRKALRATKDNRIYFEKERDALEETNTARRTDAEGTAHSLDGQVCTLLRLASDSGHLYGSVTARDIASAVSELGVSVDRREVLLNRAIKSLGIHPIRLKLHAEVFTNVQVIIARSEEEAAAQHEALARGEVAALAAPDADLIATPQVESIKFFEDDVDPTQDEQNSQRSDEKLKESSPQKSLDAVTID